MHKKGNTSGVEYVISGQNKHTTAARLLPSATRPSRNFSLLNIASSPFFKDNTVLS